MAGIAKAKAEKPESYQERPTTVNGYAIRNLLEFGIKPIEVARKLGASKTTVYRYRVTVQPS